MLQVPLVTLSVIKALWLQLPHSMLAAATTV